jgi:DNA polymerase-3 subunit chi
MEIRFYHLQRTSVEQVLPSLLERAYGQGMRSVVVGEVQRLKSLDALLWTYRPDSFLPHGLANEDYAEAQPILLAPSIQNPNNATVLFLLEDADIADASGFTLCCQLFDGNDETVVAAARQRWKALKDSDHTLTYWQQTETGWEKKV